MRYVCICCEAAGADGNGHNSRVGPYSYNCHICNKDGTMWPEPQASKFLRTVKAFQEPRGDNEADRRVISALQEVINDLKATLAEISNGQSANM